MTRLLITGGSGYLGQHLVPVASRSYEVLYTYFSHDPLAVGESRQLDLRDARSVRWLAKEWKPEIIIHTAGSNRSGDMETVIGAGAKQVSEMARLSGARLIHLSTDVLFDGRHAPYREKDEPQPIHSYGRAKAAAEKIVAEYPDHAIIRTSLIYGLKIMDHSTEWTVTSLKAGRPVLLFTNQIRNPVWTGTLVAACLELAESSYRGIVHVAGRQVMSRAEFGLRLLDWWKVKDRDSLSVGESGPEWPLDCRLDLSLATSLLSVPMLGVDEVLNQGDAG